VKIKCTRWVGSVRNSHRLATDFNWTARVSRRVHELSRGRAKASSQQTVRSLTQAVEAYLGGSVPVQNLFLELHFGGMS